MAQERHDAIHTVCLGDDVDVVALLHLILGPRHERMTIANDDADDDTGAAGRGQLLHPPPDQRASARVAVDAQQLNPTVGQRHSVEGAGRLEPAYDAVGDLDLGRDDHVDGQLVGGVETLPDRLQIAMMADAGDAPADIEQGIGHLAGDHVDFVGAGHCDQHVGIAGTGPLEDLGMGGMADHPADIVALVGPPGLLRRNVHDRHINTLGGKMAGDGRADLSGTANDHSHGALIHPNGFGSRVI